MRIDHHPKLRNRYLLLIVLASLFSPASVLLAQVARLSAGEIYRASAPSVVYIEKKDEKGDVWTGTGFVVGADGKILTNYHVIRNAKEASVRLANGDRYDTVEVLDVDRRKDIALIKIKAIDLQPLRVGNSGAAQIGDTVYSLSNPLGLYDNTLSEGIISGIRQRDGYRVLQITAPISHGSSGGPLFNARGEVVGITFESREEGQSLNFAVPIDYARGMLASPSPPRPLASVYDPDPPSPAQSAPPASTEAGPSSVTLYIKCIGGSAGAVSQFGTGTSPANFVPYLNSLPASCPTPEVPIGTVTDATQPPPFAIHTFWQGHDYWAFSTGTDQASKVAFSEVKQTGPDTIVMHLNDAAHYLVGSDEANNILIQIRLVVNESQPPTSRTSDKKAGAIDGSWSATVADSKASGRLEFNLIQNSDGEVVGTYTSSLGGGGKIKGQLTEIDFRFELTQTIAGCPGIYKGTGTRIGDHIAGSYTGNDCLGDRGTGTFTMTRGTSAEPASSTSSGRTSSVGPVPEEMRKSVGDFLASRLLVWSEQDARTVMGEPLSHRYAYDQARSVTGDIYTFRDPTLNADHIELSFDSKTNRLTNVYLYPARLTTWEDCKKLWGKDATVAMKKPDGSKIYSYKNRHLNVLLDKNNRVVNLGLY
jgi:hypothetical protein